MQYSARRRVSFPDQTLATIKFAEREESLSNGTHSDRRGDKEKNLFRQLVEHFNGQSSPVYWTVNFQQPIPYWLMNRQLIEGSIALERAAVKQSLGVLVGWIRLAVSNVETRVFVHYTVDDWCTSRQCGASLLATGDFVDGRIRRLRSSMGDFEVYVFKINLREAKQRIEFEVCCTRTFADGVVREYYDDNWGHKYILIQQGRRRGSVSASADAAAPKRRWSFS